MIKNLVPFTSSSFPIRIYIIFLAFWQPPWVLALYRLGGQSTTHPFISTTLPIPPIWPVTQTLRTADLRINRALIHEHCMPIEKCIWITVWKMWVFKDSNIKYTVFLMWKEHYQRGWEDLGVIQKPLGHSPRQLAIGDLARAIGLDMMTSRCAFLSPFSDSLTISRSVLFLHTWTVSSIQQYGGKYLHH